MVPRLGVVSTLVTGMGAIVSLAKAATLLRMAAGEPYVSQLDHLVPRKLAAFFHWRVSRA